MKLFDLEATLSLDVSDFTTGVEQAIDKGKKIGKTIDNISTDSLEKELADLDKEIAATDKEISELEKEISSLSPKASIVEGIIDGLVDVGMELVEKGIESLVEFGAESLEAVATSGSAIGNQLKQAQGDYEITMQALKLKAGQTLAPIATSFYELAESLSDVTRQEKVNILLSNLNSYSFSNLKTVESSLENIFGLFDEYEPTAPDALTSVEQMTSGLQSQADYWKSYEGLLQKLQERGMSAEFLSQYADGSQESYDMLRSMGRASDEEIAALESSYAEMEEARASAAKAISDAQLSVDESVADMVNAVARIATEVSEVDAKTATTEVVQGMVDAMSSQYPYVASWVDTINAKIATLGITVKGRSAMDEAINQGFVGGDMAQQAGQAFGNLLVQWTGKAVGFDYVPYNNYPALLHEGEAVLTKAEATEWRRGAQADTGGGTITAAALAAAVKAALADVVIEMDGTAVGRMTAPTVSKEIAMSSKARRYG